MDDGSCPAQTNRMRFTAFLTNDSSIKQFVDHTVYMVDPCEVAVLSINSAVLSALTYSYDIGAPMVTLQASTSDLSPSPVPPYSCGTMAFTITYADGSAIDSSVFTTSFAGFSTETGDLAKAGVYDFVIDANYVGYTNPQSANRSF